MAKLQSLSVIALLFIVVFLLNDTKQQANHWEFEATANVSTNDSLRRIVNLQDLTIGAYGRTYDILVAKHPDLQIELDSIMSVVH